jgi:hypothetical protein
MQFEKHKSAKQIFHDIDISNNKYLIIHYSCQSFYGREDGTSPRITSIAVHNYTSGQTESFSIHMTAEKDRIDFIDIENKYNDLEKKMLKEFYTYVQEHKDYIWIHWNMRNSSYGFQAIEHRYSVLGGKPVIIPYTNRVDLSLQLINYYGAGYMNNPRMESLIKLNKISSLDFLSGKEEADAFEKKEYVKLHKSTLRKVLIFTDIISRVNNNKLKVKSKWYEIYGYTPQGIFNLCSETWWIQLIINVVLLVLGAILGVVFDRLC